MAGGISKSIYQALVDDITAIYTQAHQKARNTLDHLRAEAYWKIGQRIVEVEQKHNIRAAYGAKLLEDLSKDLTAKFDSGGFSLTNLKNMRKFYLNYAIGQAPDQLGWTQYQTLCLVKDKDARLKLEQAAIKNNWSSREIKEQIKSQHFEVEVVAEASRLSKGTGHATKLSLRRGRLRTYRLAKLQCLHSSESSVLVDLGFNVFRTVALKGVARPREGDILEWTGAGFSRAQTSVAEIYTYAAYLEKVVDGDTLWCQIDLGFDNWIRQKLRLRGIDCPEINTRSGQKARAFVQQALKQCPFIVIKTFKSDKYDRYLSNIFYDPKSQEEGQVAQSGIFLNQQLLDKRFAVIMG